VLFNILETSESSPAIEWLRCGRVFRINDQETFAKEIMPKYFESEFYDYLAFSIVSQKMLNAI